VNAKPRHLSLSCLSASLGWPPGPSGLRLFSQDFPVHGRILPSPLGPIADSPARRLSPGKRTPCGRWFLARWDVLPSMAVLQALEALQHAWSTAVAVAVTATSGDGAGILSGPLGVFSKRSGRNPARNGANRRVMAMLFRRPIRSGCSRPANFREQAAPRAWACASLGWRRLPVDPQCSRPFGPARTAPADRAMAGGSTPAVDALGGACCFAAPRVGLTGSGKTWGPEVRDLTSLSFSGRTLFTRGCVPFGSAAAF